MSSDCSFMVSSVNLLSECSACRQKKKKKLVVQQWLQTFWNFLSFQCLSFQDKCQIWKERKGKERISIGKKQWKSEIHWETCIKRKQEQREESSAGPPCIAGSMRNSVACWDLLEENSHDVIPHVIGPKHLYMRG